jgi:hypothetical protein
VAWGLCLSGSMGRGRLLLVLSRWDGDERMG